MLFLTEVWPLQGLDCSWVPREAGSTVDVLGLEAVQALALHIRSRCNNASLAPGVDTAWPTQSGPHPPPGLVLEGDLHKQRG